MTAAQTLSVVHSLLDNMKVVMDGESSRLANSKRLIRLLSLQVARHQRKKSDGLLVCAALLCESLASMGMLVTIQEVANEINKMKRTSSHQLFAPWRVNHSLRRPATKGF